MDSLTIAFRSSSLPSSGSGRNVPLECRMMRKVFPGEVAFVDFPGLLTQGKVIQQGDAAALALMPFFGDVGDSAVAQPGTARLSEEEP
jgi:hypothetical protein